MTPENSRDEEIFNAYAAGMAEEHIQQRYRVSAPDIRRIVAADLAQETPTPRADPEDILSAYAAGVAVEHIAQRYGISEDEVRTVVAVELGMSGDQSTGSGNARSEVSFANDLADWTDWDGAAFRLGQAIGLFSLDAGFTPVKHVFGTDHALGSGLHDALLALVSAGVLDRRQSPDEQFRWNAASFPRR